MRRSIPFGDLVNVSTLTTLLQFQTWTNLDSLLVALVNLDTTNPVTLRVETSEDGIHPDDEYFEKVAPAGKQASIEIGPSARRTYWRVSAYTASPAYPTVAVKWKLTWCSTA